VRPRILDDLNGRERHRQRALAQELAGVALVRAVARHVVRAGVPVMPVLPSRLRRWVMVMMAAAMVSAPGLRGSGGGRGAEFRSVRVFVREPAQGHGEEIPRQDQPPQAALSHFLKHSREPSDTADVIGTAIVLQEHCK
jgi:hypothetical protein